MLGTPPPSESRLIQSPQIVVKYLPGSRGGEFILAVRDRYSNADSWERYVVSADGGFTIRAASRKIGRRVEPSPVHRRDDQGKGRPRCVSAPFRYSEKSWVRVIAAWLESRACVVPLEPVLETAILALAPAP